MNIDWKDIGKTLANLGLPLLGASVGGPAGAAVGKLIASALGLSDSSPSAINDALAGAQRSDATVIALRTLELNHQADLFRITTEAETSQIVAVNTTMQAEAKSEHWLQWAWRPLNGLSLAIGSLAGVVGVLYLAYQAIITKDPGVLNMIPSLVSGVAMVLAVPGAVCGVTSWGRNALKMEQQAAVVLHAPVEDRSFK